MIVRMWEVRAQQRTFADLLNWVCEVALPSIEVEPLHVSSEVFASPDFRLVVLSRWRSGPRELPAPPPALVITQPHFWDFSPVDR